MIKQFDKDTCKLLAKEIEQALAVVAAKHGLTSRYAGGTFDEAMFAPKIRFRLAESNPASKEIEQKEFAKYCAFYGLQPTDYGAVLPTNTHGEVTLIGFEVRRPRFPIKVRSADGKIRLFQTALIMRLQKASIPAFDKLIEETAP